MKLYFKKLLLTLLFFAAFIVLAGLLLTLLVHALFWFRPYVKVVIYVGLVLSAAILSFAVFLKRWENKSLKAAFLGAEMVKDYSFRKDYTTVLLSRENVVHTLAFLSIAFINAVRLTITAHKPLTGLLIQVVILVLLFTALNTLIWCFVHKKWHKSRYGTK